MTFAFVLVLLAICMLGLGLAGSLSSQQTRREREQELLRLGALYARAIADYQDRSPGTLRQHPPSLDALLLDTRYVGVARYLRKIHADPVGHQPWGLVLDSDQRIVGVYSRSDEAPIAHGPVDLGDVLLAPAQHYSDWKFIVKTKS